MSKPISNLWVLGPFAALLLVVAVLYAEVPGVRGFVDSRFPWVQAKTTRFFATSTPVGEAQNSEVAASTTPLESLPPNKTEELMAPAPTPPSTPLTETASALPITVERLCEDHSLWPKTLILKRSADFPAVVNGKITGRVQVPAGAIVNLVRLQPDKAGVEFRGGGTWLKIAETDLPDRIKAMRLPATTATR